MKGYNTENGYMGYVGGEYLLFASEADYREFFDRIYADWPYDIRSEGIAGDGKTGTRLMLNRDSGEVWLAKITLYALEKLTGRISEELLLLAVDGNSLNHCKFTFFQPRRGEVNTKTKQKTRPRW